MCQWGAYKEPMGRLSNRPIPDTTYPRHVSHNPQTGVEKFPFQIAAKRLEIDESVNRTHLVRHFLALNRIAFSKAPNE